MSEILVEKAIDRSLHPGVMMYVDKVGNICKADRRQKMTTEERAKKDAENKEKRDVRNAESKRLQQNISTKKKVYQAAAKEMDMDKINAALEELKKAEEEYKTFKGD